MAEATLNDVINRLRTDNAKQLEEQRDTTAAIESLSDNINDLLLQLEIQGLRSKETESEKRKLGAVIGGGRSSSGSGGLGSSLRGMMGGILGSLGGLLRFGGGALAGIIGFIALGAIDTQRVKNNVETLLSIGDRYNDNAIGRLLSDGIVVVGLRALGTALVPFAIGGALNAGVDYFSDGNWAQNVKDNVATLLSIGNITGIAQGAQLLFSGAAVPFALQGLGVGLAAFGVGQALTGLGQWVTDTTWAQQVKENVLTLLSISNGLGESIGNLVEGVLFVPAMAGLAAGLSVFAVGSAATGLSQFITGDGWSQEVKDNVLTLLSIKDELGGTGVFIGQSAAFLGSMTGIGLGLAAFGAGAVTVAGTDMLGDWFANGEGRQDWAQEVVNNVQTLLSIASLPNVGADTGTFIATMGGLAAGLLAFSAGTGVVSITDAFADWISPGEGRQSWSQELYNNVANVLSVVDLTGADGNKATRFVDAMEQIKNGLNSFSGGSFVGTLRDAASSILGFFTGAESPFDQIMRVADNAESLQQGATAVDSLTASLATLGNLRFDGSRLNISALADDLLEAVPTIEKAIMGDNGGWFGTEIKGLASPEINYDDAIRNITALRSALLDEQRNELNLAYSEEMTRGRTAGGGVGDTNITQIRSGVENLMLETASPLDGQDLRVR